MRFLNTVFFLRLRVGQGFDSPDQIPKLSRCRSQWLPQRRVSLLSKKPKRFGIQVIRFAAPTEALDECCALVWRDHAHKMAVLDEELSQCLVIRACHLHTDVDLFEVAVL